MEWYAFTEKHPQAHLVAGEYDPGEIVPRVSRFGILGRLVLALQPTGDWAMQRVQPARRMALYVAYEKRTDAARLRASVGAIRAVTTARQGRWTSQFEFWFDREMYAKIAAATTALHSASETE